jgi:tetratricopeptide (TPR) repeat protein
MMLVTPVVQAQPGRVLTVDQAQRTGPSGPYRLLGLQPELSLTFSIGYFDEIRSQGSDWFRERLQIDIQRDGELLPVRIATLQDVSYRSSDETVRMRVTIERPDKRSFVSGEYSISIDLSPILMIVLSDDLSRRSGPPATQSVRLLIQEVVTREQQIEFHNREGNRHMRAANLPEAIKHFEQSLRIEPDQPQPTGALGVSYFGLRRYNDAIRLLEGALPAWLRMPEQRGNPIPGTLAAAYIEVGREEDAVRTLRASGHDDDAIRSRIEALRKAAK